MSKNHFKSILVVTFWVLAPFYVNAQSVSQSEAGYGCINGRCIAAAEKSSLMNFCEQMKSRAAWAQDWQCQNAEYIEGDEDRTSIHDLRRRFASNPASLSDEDKALARAANRVGFIAFNDCKKPNGEGIIGNAFLIKVNGKDAVITDVHLVLNGKNGGRSHYGCSKEQLTNNVSYFPNASYLGDSSKGQEVFQKIRLDGQTSYNFEEQIDSPTFHTLGGALDDWAIFMLPEQISEQKAPDGQVRGFIPMDTAPEKPVDQSYKGVTIGYDPEFVLRNGAKAFSYQKCDFYDGRKSVPHTCDTSDGASVSLLGVYNDGEIRFRAIHTGFTPTLEQYAELKENQREASATTNRVAREYERPTSGSAGLGANAGTPAQGINSLLSPKGVSISD